ncbi:MAG: hypothetical protein C0476_07695 [Sphingomonas sp.]|nr:hypothetical protein [Sphingomonas sp.]
MEIAEEQVLREKTAAIVFDWAAGRTPPFTGETHTGFAEAIGVAHLVSDEARVNLHRWIDAARRAGLSWSEIGETLGMSKQAAQQRFRPGETTEDVAGDIGDEMGEDIIRKGATAFNEMSMLRDEGRKGHELIRTGALTLVFRPTSQFWEYRRSFGLSYNLPREMQAQGWRYVSTWLPFHYFKRATGPL